MTLTRAERDDQSRERGVYCSRAAGIGHRVCLLAAASLRRELCVREGETERAADGCYGADKRELFMNGVPNRGSEPSILFEIE